MTRDALVLSRRSLIAASFSAGGLLAAHRLLGQQGGTPSTTLPDLVIRNPRALDAETPLGSLANYHTAPERFFVRSHFGPPTEVPLDWKLTIDGEVGAPITFSLDDIRKLAPTTRSVTLECAGNGRGVFDLKSTSGVQWQYGAVSTAAWSGVSLGALLERAGLRSSAQHLWMEARDQAPLPTVPKFLRSIPRAVALGDAFVAYEMNGRAIPLLHGGPLRLIVPGWFGMASTKWLSAIHARTLASDNFFMAHGYRYADQSPVQELHVKSVIASPLADERVRVGTLSVKGQAWTGTSGGAVQTVDVSADGGHSWRPARLVGPEQRGAWRSWEADVVAAPGDVTLMARATDSSGAIQPAFAIANPGGYGNNSIHQVRVHATTS